LSILDQIVVAKRRRLDLGEYAPLARPAPRGNRAAFVEALSAPGARIVAEIKGRSPSAGEILHGADGRVESMALAYRRGHAAALSVVIEEDFFCGKPEWLPRAKRIAGLPALMKDFVVSERQLDFAVSLGADAVLLIARALSDEELVRLGSAAHDRSLATVVEAHDAHEIRRAAGFRPDVLGVNARNLSTFETSLDALAALGELLPAGPVHLAESGIRTAADVKRLRGAGFQAFLVGESLLRHEEPEALLRELQS